MLIRCIFERNERIWQKKVSLCPTKRDINRWRWQLFKLENLSNLDLVSYCRMVWSTREIISVAFEKESNVTFIMLSIFLIFEVLDNLLQSILPIDTGRIFPMHKQIYSEKHKKKTKSKVLSHEKDSPLQDLLRYEIFKVLSQYCSLLSIGFQVKEIRN